MLYRFKLKNREDKYITIDEQSYKYFMEDPVFKEMNLLENLRQHATSGAAVFQKWYRNLQNKSYQETVYLHKAIAEKFLTKPSDRHNYVLHINGDRLDDRIENLAWVTRSELNRYCNYETDSGYRGVRKEKNKFRAMIYIDKKPMHLGVFDTAEEAAKAYNDAAIEHGLVNVEINKLRKAASKEITTPIEKVKKKAK